MVAEVDEPTGMLVAVPAVVLDASGEPADALGELRLRLGAGHQPRLGAGRLRLRDQCLEHGEADDEVTEPEGNRREVDAIHLDPRLRRARSGSRPRATTRRTPAVARHTCCTGRS